MKVYFKVRNFEKFQHYKDRNPPWIKLYNHILEDYDFSKLQDLTKLQLILIWLLASRLNNKIPYDSDWVRQKIGCKSKPNLKELEKMMFIEVFHDDDSVLADCTQDDDREREKIKEEKKIEKSSLSDQDFIQSLKTNKAYQHISIDHELGKMDAWLSVHPQRKKTRRFVVNWLNKIEKPMEGHHDKSKTDFEQRTSGIRRFLEKNASEGN